MASGGLSAEPEGHGFHRLTSQRATEARMGLGAVPGARTGSRAGPGPRRLAEGFTSSVGCLAVWSRGSSSKARALCLRRGQCCCPAPAGLERVRD